MIIKQSIPYLVSLLLISLSAYISVTLPISEKGIPFTAQSLMIFVVAGLLKPRMFLAVIISYLLLGIAGLPIFAEGTSGWAKIVGSSGGFLYGFVISGLAISYGLKSSNKSSLVKVSGIMIIGTICLFVCGLGHLAMKFGYAKALEYGLYPFWKMALLKAFLAAIAVFLLLGRRSSRL